MLSLSEILGNLLNRLISTEEVQSGDLTDVLYSICRNRPFEGLCSFGLDEASSVRAMSLVEEQLRNSCPTYQQISQSVSYLLDELICNMQQHSQVSEGQLYAHYDPEQQNIDIVLADYGISIYGSYVRAQKYLDLIGNSDAEALGLAKDGYSTKNLPETENRGYGISSNTKMVTRGLHGEFAIYSGNALFLQTANETKLLELPEQLDMRGTLVVVRIPAQVPDNYNFYEYIS